MVAKEGKTVQSTDQKWQKPPVRVGFSRTGYMIVAWLFLIYVVIQVFIAGMAIFGNPAHWRQHTTFVHLFEFIPILMFILGFSARLPRKMIWGSLGLYALIFVQYATANGVVAALTRSSRCCYFGSG